MVQFIWKNRNTEPLQLKIRTVGIIEFGKSGSKLLSMPSCDVTIIGQNGETLTVYKSSRESIHAPHGAQVLPYFKKNGEWYVVMVEQFRIAIRSSTLEAAGGEVTYESPTITMARELKEEEHISVDPKRIEYLFRRWIQPSTFDSIAHGGIVEIEESEIPIAMELAGEHKFGEYTVAVVKPLIELLNLKDSKRLAFDLWGSCLLDEVAKKVGLLVKNY